MSSNKSMLKAALSYVAEGFSVDIRANDSYIVANHHHILGLGEDVVVAYAMAVDSGCRISLKP